MSKTIPDNCTEYSIIADHVLCLNCDVEQLVNVGDDACPLCKNESLIFVNSDQETVER